MEPFLSGYASAKVKPLEEENKVIKEFTKQNALSKAQALDADFIDFSDKKWFHPAVERLVAKGKLIEVEKGKYYVDESEQEAQAKWQKNRWFIIPGGIIVAIIITWLIYK